LEARKDEREIVWVNIGEGVEYLSNAETIRDGPTGETNEWGSGERNTTNKKEKYAKKP